MHSLDPAQAQPGSRTDTGSCSVLGPGPGWIWGNWAVPGPVCAVPGRVGAVHGGDIAAPRTGVRLWG